MFEFYSVIDNLRAEPFSLKDESNTLLHIWGYFKNITLLKEKEFFFKNYELFREGEIKKEKMINIIKTLTKKYNIKYLKDSYYIKGV